MPKGVEHILRPVDLSDANPVIYPLMPKGVEHGCRFERRESRGRVIYPLMPKGVEHLDSIGALDQALERDLSVDAERR